MKPKKRAPTLSRAEVRTQRLDARQRVKDTRAVLATANKAKRAALAEVRARLKAARKALPARLAHWREINRQIMRRAIEGERHAVRAEALAARTGTESRAHEMARAANRQIEADLKHLRWLGKARHAAPKSSARVMAGLRAAELRAEADDFTRQELPEEMWAAWEMHKHRIKATPRTTRWEEALTFFHRHPHLILEANEAADARAVEATIAREYEERAREEPTRTRRAVKVAKASKKKASKKKASKKKASKKAASKKREVFSGGHSLIRTLAKERGAMGPLLPVERAALEALEHGAATVEDLGTLSMRADFAGLDWGDLYPEWRAFRAAGVPF